MGPVMRPLASSESKTPEVVRPEYAASTTAERSGEKMNTQGDSPPRRQGFVSGQQDMKRSLYATEDRAQFGYFLRKVPYTL